MTVTGAPPRRSASVKQAARDAPNAERVEVARRHGVLHRIRLEPRQLASRHDDGRVPQLMLNGKPTDTALAVTPGSALARAS